MILFKRFMVCALCVAVTLTSVYFFKSAEQISVMSENSDIRPTIIIDAGHGGFDGGALAEDGTLEKDLNLKIAKRLKHLLLQGGFYVIMIRNDDVSVEDDPEQSIAKRKVSDMKRRLEIIKSHPNAIFVSIHLNKYTTASPRGAQVFYSVNVQNSSVLADKIQSSFKALLQPENNRSTKAAGKEIFLLYNATIPAVIVECGFLSNCDELSLLKNEEYQTKSAIAIYCGILEYFMHQE